ncbi:MAG: hypothetical protein RR280_08585 [Bacteroidaceae bacterium]
MLSSEFKLLKAKIAQHLVGTKKTFLDVGHHYVYHSKVGGSGFSCIFRGLNVNVESFSLYDWDESQQRWLKSDTLTQGYYVLTHSQNIIIRRMLNEASGV